MAPANNSHHSGGGRAACNQNSGVNPQDVGLVIFATSYVHLRWAGSSRFATRNALTRCAHSTPDDLFGERPPSPGRSADQRGRVRPHRCLLGVPVCDGNRLALPDTGAFQSAVVVGECLSRWVDWEIGTRVSSLGTARRDGVARR